MFNRLKLLSIFSCVVIKTPNDEYGRKFWDGIKEIKKITQYQHTFHGTDQLLLADSMVTYEWGIQKNEST